MSKNIVFYIMGVSGCGKSTIGKLLAERLSIPFFDGDDYHPQSNLDKMSKGVPLNDSDREEWLKRLNKLALEQVEKNSCIIACSALKSAYRKKVSKHLQEQVQWVHLKGSFEQIFERINQRKRHFMSSDLLQSQFDTLETPEDALQINVRLTPEDIVQKIIDELIC